MIKTVQQLRRFKQVFFSSNISSYSEICTLLYKLASLVLFSTGRGVVTSVTNLAHWTLSTKSAKCLSRTAFEFRVFLFAVFISFNLRI